MFLQYINLLSFLEYAETNSGYEYLDGNAYDDANTEENNLASRRGHPQEVEVETIQNPYYGVDDAPSDLNYKNPRGIGDVRNVKVTQNPYYA